MPGKKKDTETQVTANVFSTEEATRKNIPEAGMVDYEPKGLSKNKTYCWDPRESPQLIWAGKAGMKKVEVEEQASLEIPTVNLHIHERVAPEAIIRSLKREDVQRSLFADPVMDFKEEVKFYQHEVNWSNRMILGDSLLVMNSLLEREGMRGSVQCIYMDPPYGIKYKSNFQPRIDKRDVKDGADDDLSREVEVVQAFRDTWELGIHSYLSYMRDRLIVARELLKDEGSIFVQIGDENVHRVRCLMDEVFGEENFVAQISYVTSTGSATDLLPRATDFVLWFAKSKLLLEKSGRVKSIFLGEPESLRPDGEDCRGPFELGDMTSQDPSATRSGQIEFRGESFIPSKNRHWSFEPSNISRLEAADRVVRFSARQIRWKKYLDERARGRLTNQWSDTQFTGFASNKEYVVQTAVKVIQRCILLTTDPGDLVLDPTCGSGTTAYVAEQWGRRWITCDTSRVALAIARHRLMTASFDYYKLRFPAAGISGGFKYKTVPHITLKSIAQNKEIDEIAAKYQPEIDAALEQVNEAFGKDWKEWEVPVPSSLTRLESTDPTEIGRELFEYLYGAGEKVNKSIFNVRVSALVLALPKGAAVFDLEEGATVHFTHPDGEIRPNELTGAPAAMVRFWMLKRNMQAEIDASIQRNAPQEELVDQPETERNIVRVSGPFTMEAIPDTAEISMEVEHIPGDGEAENAVPGLDIAVFGSASQAEATNAGAYIADMIEKLRKSGVHARGKGKFEFASLRPLSHEVLHAEGEIIIKNGVEKQLRCAVLFGAQNGVISETHVKEGMAAGRRYDAVLFCGYDFTATAQDMVNEHRDKDWLLMMSYISPDTVMGDLLKDTKAAQLFTLVGEPDVVVYSFADPDLAALVKDAEERKVPEVAARAASLKEGEVFVELRGVDLYNPVSGETSSDHGAGVHAIFVDHDYDGKSFCICQALFPNKKDSWDKIARSLKGSLDEEALDAMRTCVSLPFKVGKEGRIQVKVIDARGNSVVKTVRVR